MATSTTTHAPDPRIACVLLVMLAAGTMAMLCLPFLRGYHAQIGWLPLWLLLMPAAALVCLYRFRLPRQRHRQHVTCPR